MKALATVAAIIAGIIVASVFEVSSIINESQSVAQKWTTAGLILMLLFVYIAGVLCVAFPGGDKAKR